MGVCGLWCFFLCEFFILLGDDFEQGIACSWADDGDALGWQCVFPEMLECGLPIGPAGAENVQRISGVGPCGTASSNETGCDGQRDRGNA